MQNIHLKRIVKHLNNCTFPAQAIDPISPPNDLYLFEILVNQGLNVAVSRLATQLAV